MNNSKHPQLCLAMSQIIAADAPLLSPVSADGSWDQQQDFNPAPDFFPYYTMPQEPESPVHQTMLRTVDDHAPGSLPTHQLFDFPMPAHAAQAQGQSTDVAPQTPPTRAVSLQEHPAAPSTEDTSEYSSSTNNKRSASPAPAGQKKPRAVGERISSKDFVPPDVSGLSKREARLVKNRAAAFLSRQRKREEFECMEVRVHELEQENARLQLALAHGIPMPASMASSIIAASSTQPAALSSSSDPHSEVEQLRAQLAQAQRREQALSAQLSRTTSASMSPSPQPASLSSINGEIAVKQEPMGDNCALLASPPRAAAANASNANGNGSKSGASLGLMVLLCALPTLLTMRTMHPTGNAPTSFSIPNPFPSRPHGHARSHSHSSTASFDYHDFDYELSGDNWSPTSPVRSNPAARPTSSSFPSTTTTSLRKKLEFADMDIDALAPGLGDLDISFDTVEADDGRIRVRIHPSVASNSNGNMAIPASSLRAQSPGASSTISDSSSSGSSSGESQSSLSMWNGAPVKQFMGGAPPSVSGSASNFSPIGSLPPTSSLAGLHNELMGATQAAWRHEAGYGGSYESSKYPSSFQQQQQQQHHHQQSSYQHQQQQQQEHGMSPLSNNGMMEDDSDAAAFLSAPGFGMYDSLDDFDMQMLGLGMDGASPLNAGSPESLSSSVFGAGTPGFGMGSQVSLSQLQAQAQVAQMMMTKSGQMQQTQGQQQQQGQGEKKRVRIALKSLPEAGGAEGGEWEVQIC